jgi:hypothetical protein
MWLKRERESERVVGKVIRKVQILTSKDRRRQKERYMQRTRYTQSKAYKEKERNRER